MLRNDQTDIFHNTVYDTGYISPDYFCRLGNREHFSLGESMYKR